MPDITNAEEARAELEQAREEFRELVLGLTEAEWNRKSDNGGWTNCQLCWHIAFTARGGTIRVSRLRQSKGMNPPAPLMGVLNLFSLWLVRIRSRGATPQSVLALFDEGFAITQGVIDTVGDDEWGNGAVFLGELMTVRDSFRFLGEHVRDHATELRRG